jgi:hypothetical protein
MKRQLGSYGESLVEHYFAIKGCQVKRSEDWFDDEKDMTIDGQTVEVKTLFPIIMYNSFCIPWKQVRKCEEVDRLIFVKIPYEENGPVHIYEALRDEETGRRYDFREKFNSETCAFFRLTFLKEIDIIHSSEISKTLFDLSLSTYKKVA